MKKILIGVCFVLLSLAIASWIYRDETSLLLVFDQLDPEQKFSAGHTPASSDYSQPAGWAVLPDRGDSADALASIGVIDQPASAAANVFFIHPTEYFDTANWNQLAKPAITRPSLVRQSSN
jgi:hypothetical protein